MNEKLQEKSNLGCIIGFDCHPETFTAAIVEGKDPVNTKILRIDHLCPIKTLENWLAKKVKDNDLIVIEASGNTFNVVNRIKKAGKSVVILDSFSANKVKKSYCTTDKESAVSLARIYLSGLASIVWNPDKQTLDRREILHYHNKAVSDTVRAKNRIYGYLNRHCLLKLKKSDYLKNQALQKILVSNDWTDVQKEMITQMFDDLRYATEKRKKFRSIMAQDILSDAQGIKLVRIFGIRHITAYALMAIIGDINRFSNPKKLVAYIGLNPQTKQSGKTDKSSGMSRHGRRDLRSLLVESAHTIFNNQNNPLYKWAWKLEYRKGKNASVIAVARKIVVSIWYLLKGMYTNLEEIPENIKLKINRLASEIGAQAVKSFGYKTLKAYQEEKYKFLLESS